MHLDMKKILYSLLAILAISVASCTKFEEPEVQVYAPAPGVTVQVKAVADSSVTFTLTIDTINTKYYAISFFKGNASTPDSMALLKLAAGGDAKLFNAQGKDRKWDANGTLTYTYTKLDPNTTYWFYAVASSTMGMVSSVSGAKAVTTDGLSPDIKEDNSGKKAGAVAVTFTEPMKLGKGKISAQYVASYDETFTLVDVDSADIVVDFAGATVSISADSVPAGAIVLVSWETGAFTDIYGNPCEAFTSSLAEFPDVMWYTVENKSFAISEANLTDTVGIFADYATYKAEFKFDFPIFARALDAKANEKYDPIEVTIYAADYTMVVDGVSAKWSVKDSSLFVSFPKEVPVGAYVSMSIPANLIVDIYGNSNSEVDIDQYWRCFSRAAILGSYEWVYMNEKKKVVRDTITIAADPANPNGLLIDDLLMAGSELEAELEGDILVIPDMQLLGVEAINDSVAYYVVSSTYDLLDIRFEFDKDMTAVSNSDESEQGILWFVQYFDDQFEYAGFKTYTTSDIYLLPIKE